MQKGNKYTLRMKYKSNCDAVLRILGAGKEENLKRADDITQFETSFTASNPTEQLQLSGPASGDYIAVEALEIPGVVVAPTIGNLAFPHLQSALDFCVPQKQPKTTPMLSHHHHHHQVKKMWQWHTLSLYTL